MGDSKLLEPQINTMHELWYQLVSLGGKIPDSNFAMAISEALPPSYDTLKTIAITNVTNTSALATKTLITHILCKEKCKQHQSGVAMMFAKSNKLNCQDSQKPSASKLNAAKSLVTCTNPKCRRPGHMFEQCWVEDGGNEGQKKRQHGRCTPSTQSLGALKESAKVASSSDVKQEMLIAWTNDQLHALLTNGHTCHSEWIINSRATSHLCGNHDWFISYCILNTPCKVILGNKQKILAPGIGQIEVNLEVGKSSQLTTIHNVLYCPSISHNLLSIPQLTSIGAHVQFANKSCHIYGLSKKLITVAELEDGLYRLPVTVVTTEKAYITVIGTSDSANVACLITASASLDIWHVHLGHISMDLILKMLQSGMVKGMDVIGKKLIDDSTHCSECKVSSHHRNPIPSETHTHSDWVLGQVLSDVCEVQTVTHEGFKYFITFIDDFSHFLTVYPIKNKSDTLEKFKEYLAEAEWQMGCRLKTLQTDGGGKYFSSDFVVYLKSVGITHESTNPHTPQENSVTERVNWTLVTMTIVMLKSVKSKVSHTAWPYAIWHATLIKNVSPHSSLPDSTSPYERYTGNKPSISMICNFGCEVTLHIHHDLCHKLDNHSIPGIHIGIAQGKKAFLVYDPQTCKFTSPRMSTFSRKWNPFQNV